MMLSLNARIVLILLLALEGVEIVFCFISSSLHEFEMEQYIVVASRRQRLAGSTTEMNMFDQLSSAISDATSKFGNKKRMTEKSIKPALRDVRRALLDADVNIKVADTLIEGVKTRSLGAEVTRGVTSEQQFVKAMYDELLDMMGGDSSTQKTSTINNIPAARLAKQKNVGDPAIVLLAGLQGAGKTTAAGKLALYLKEREVDYVQVNAMSDEKTSQMLASRMPKTNRKVLLAAADVYRPAAIKQLEVLGESIGVEVYSMGTEANPVDIAINAVQKAKDEGFDTVIVDTAGRQVVDTDLMDELRQMKETVKPDETLLVVDAMTGQEAASLTSAFDSAVGISGAILTKLDGDSRGGAAVSVRGVSGKPIKFVGTGEKTPDLEPFYPDRMASRILGMGDIVSLVEKAASLESDAEAERVSKKMLEAKFDFDDFKQQSEMVANMGSLASVAKMLPGMGGGALDPKKMNEAEIRLKKNNAMICSMTGKERANPNLLLRDQTARSRLKRITKGSGATFEEGLQFMSEFQKMRTMMSRMQKQMGGGAFGLPSPGGDSIDDDEVLPQMGNRKTRRAAKSKKKSRGGGVGFG